LAVLGRRSADPAPVGGEARGQGRIGGRQLGPELGVQLRETRGDEEIGEAVSRPAQREVSCGVAGGRSLAARESKPLELRHASPLYSIGRDCPSPNRSRVARPATTLGSDRKSVV